MPKAVAFSVKRVEGKAKPWCFDIPAKHSETGKRQRVFFASKEAALQAAVVQRKRISTHGAEIVLMGPKTRKDALAAHEVLEPIGITLKDAADIVAYATAILPSGTSIKYAVDTVSSALTRTFQSRDKG